MRKWGTRDSDWYGVLAVVIMASLATFILLMSRCVNDEFQNVPAANAHGHADTDVGPFMCQTAKVENGLLTYNNGYQRRTIDIKHIHTMNGVSALGDESGGRWSFWVGDNSQVLDDVDMKSCVDLFFKVVLQKIANHEQVNLSKSK